MDEHEYSDDDELRRYFDDHDELPGDVGPGHPLFEKVLASFMIVPDQMSEQLDDFTKSVDAILAGGTRSLTPAMSVTIKLPTDNKWHKMLLLLAVGEAFNDYEAKRKLMSTIGKMLCKSGVFPAMVAMASEAWKVERSQDEWDGTMPSECEDRQECISIAVLTSQNKAWSLMLDIKRDPATNHMQPVGEWSKTCVGESPLLEQVFYGYAEELTINGLGKFDPDNPFGRLKEKP